MTKQTKERIETRVGIRELRANLSEYLDRVAAGERVIVTHHGWDVAVLAPVGRRPKA